jgi:hypothetical protein
MFVPVRGSGPWEYLQIVENFREGKKVRQKVIANLGRLDILKSRRCFGLDSHLFGSAF